MRAGGRLRDYANRTSLVPSSRAPAQLSRPVRVAIAHGLFDAYYDSLPTARDLGDRGPIGGYDAVVRPPVLRQGRRPRSLARRRSYTASRNCMPLLAAGASTRLHGGASTQVDSV